VSLIFDVISCSVPCQHHCREISELPNFSQAAYSSFVNICDFRVQMATNLSPFYYILYVAEGRPTLDINMFTLQNLSSTWSASVMVGTDFLEMKCELVSDFVHMKVN